MKKPNQKQKKKPRQKKKKPANKKAAVVARTANVPETKGDKAKDGVVKARTVSKQAVKKPADKKGKEGFFLPRYVNVTTQFLREAKMELKKVKWPTRKELLASTAVVIFLSILMAFYLGLVDFGLIKIIRAIVG
ncbi:MAG: preprotein translocase subunit SecE [Deltaproteobacteria bacterium]|nr:preprotein translocase subunit SecE [Deltaproteobacteria bacterium]MBW1815879.1 preprotein translocase subunit SecE [Deltaproteobacteria bacterium]